MWRGAHLDIARAIVSLLWAARSLVVVRCSLRYRSRDCLVILCAARFLGVARRSFCYILDFVRVGSLS